MNTPPTPGKDHLITEFADDESSLDLIGMEFYRRWRKVLRCAEGGWLYSAPSIQLVMGGGYMISQTGTWGQWDLDIYLDIYDEITTT